MRDFGSNRYPITAIMKKSVRILPNQEAPLLFQSIKKEPEINSQANYYLLNFAARRDLSREALFLWINPLEAAPSIAL